MVPDLNGAFTCPLSPWLTAAHGGWSITVIKPLWMDIPPSTIVQHHKTNLRNSDFISGLNFIPNFWNNPCEILVKSKSKQNQVWNGGIELFSVCGAARQQADLAKRRGWQEINDLRTHPLSTITTSRGILLFTSWHRSIGDSTKKRLAGAILTSEDTSSCQPSRSWIWTKTQMEGNEENSC